jgi:hypothetical protein
MFKIKTMIKPETIIKPILMLFIISLSGCTLFGSTQQKYFVGTSGLEMQFVPSNPTDVFEADNFGLSLSINNLGSYTIPNATPGRLTVSYDSYYLQPQGAPVYAQIVLHAKDISYPMGDQEYYQAFFTAKSLDNLRDSVKTTIGFNLCYPYRTELSIPVCIDMKVLAQDDPAVVCHSQEYSDSTGQGAPLVITKVTPEMLVLNKDNVVVPVFKIYVKNSGKGYVLNMSTPDVCADASTKASENLNKVSIKAWLSDRELVCTPKELRLTDTGDEYFRCQVNQNVADYKRTQKNFVSPLTIRIDYGYVQVQTQQINIKRSKESIQPIITCNDPNIWSGGQCISKCDYCAKNPKDATKCGSNLPFAGFQFDASFGCYCSDAKCQTLAPNGKCIFGYCNGGMDCCSTNECDDKADGTQCGDNYVCINKVCSTTTYCAYVEQSVNNGFACRSRSLCDPNEIVAGLCPGNADNVCCIINPCKDKSDNSICGDGYVCVNHVCSTTKTNCVANYGSQGYDCRQNCASEKTMAGPGLCPAGMQCCQI